MISVTTVNGKRAECVVHVFEVSLDALNDTIARAEQLDDEEATRQAAMRHLRRH